MTLGLLIIHVVAGLTMAAHGGQKLFGWFEGPGRRGTAGMMDKLGYREPAIMASLAGLAEFAGGLGLALGFLTPLAAIAIVVVMLNAAYTVHLKNGFWNTAGGCEYPLVMSAIAVGIAATGPGDASADNALGFMGTLSGDAWAAVVIVVALIASTLTMTIGRHHERMPGHPAR
ncbi:MAG TPA: DoxX family protein [Gaiellales bacterium]|nr:DoxX family protein [Gaiellales bacterium]